MNPNTTPLTVDMRALLGGVEVLNLPASTLVSVTAANQWIGLTDSLFDEVHITSMDRILVFARLRVIALRHDLIDRLDIPKTSIAPRYLL